MRLPRLSAPGFAFLVVLVLRALLALSRWDELMGVEVYNSTLAVALIAGMDLEPTQIAIIDHLRGSAIFGFLLVPLVLVTGAPFLSLKLLACLWSALTAWLLCFALERGVSRRAAFLGAVSFALLPPSFVLVDVLALGSHGDTILFLAAAMACLAGCRPGADIGARRAAALGLALGGNVLFSMHGLISLPAVLLAWACVDPRFARRRSSLAAMLTAVAAFLPSLLLSASTNVQSKSLARQILPDGPWVAVVKLGRLLGGDLPRSLLFEEHGGVWLAWAWVLVVALGVPLAVRRARRRDPVAVFALVYPVLLLGAFCGMSFELNLVNTPSGMGSRYLMPLLPFAAIWVVLSAEELCAAGRGRLAVVHGGALCLLGAIPMLSLLDPGTAFRQPGLRGVDFGNFREHVQNAASQEPRARLELVAALDPDWASWRPLTHEFISGPQVVKVAHIEQELRLARSGDPELAPHVLTSMGSLAGKHLHLPAWTAVAQTVTEEAGLRSWFLRGVGSQYLMQIGEEEAVAAWLGRVREHSLAGLIDDVPGEYAAEVAFGAGFNLGSMFSPYNLTHVVVLGDVAENSSAWRGRFYIGLGVGYRTRFTEEGYRAPAPGALRVEGLVPQAWRAAFRTGLEVGAD